MALTSASNGIPSMVLVACTFALEPTMPFVETLILSMLNLIVSTVELAITGTTATTMIAVVTAIATTAAKILTKHITRRRSLFPEIFLSCVFVLPVR